MVLGLRAPEGQNTVCVLQLTRGKRPVQNVGGWVLHGDQSPRGFDDRGDAARRGPRPDAAESAHA